MSVYSHVLEPTRWETFHGPENEAFWHALLQAECRNTICEAYNADRLLMELMLAHQLRVQEVKTLQALEGDTTRELDFSLWE
jgi:hypothetical protein